MIKYKKSERKQLHNALKAAKKFLKTSADLDNGSTGKSSAICYAMDRAGISQESNDLACDMVMDRLEPCAMVPTWMERNIPEAKRLSAELSAIEWQMIVQDYRHRWLDALIEEFSK